jgi:vitamin B12 transporter
VTTISTVTLAEEDLEVLVPGSAVERHANSDATAASTVLRRSDLQSPGATAAALLTRVPGVQTQQTGSGSDLSTASIRGTSSAQTPVYLAGIRLNDDLSGTADLSTIPLWMLDRVEIYRGNAPANAELLGIGGAVMFEPRYPHGEQARAGVGWGSWGQRTAHVALGTGSGKVQTLMALRHESARNDYGYRDNAGTAFTTADDSWKTRVNADQTTTDWWTVSRLATGGSGNVLFLANVFDREQGVPGLLAIANKQTRAHVRRELAGVSGRTEIPCSARVRCQLRSATSFQWASTVLTELTPDFGLGASTVATDSRRVSQLTQFSWPLADDWLLVPSANMSAETLDVSRPSSTPLDAKRLEGTFGASAQWSPVRNLNLLGIARVNVEATRAASEDIVRRSPTGRFGTVIRVAPGLKLLGNLGYYDRVPTLGELYGTSAGVLGNSALKAEHGLNRDLGASYGFRTRKVAFSVETFAFQQDLSNLVAWKKSSFAQIVPYNVGRARLLGLENYLALDLFSVIHLESATTLLDPRDTTPGRTQKNDILPFRSRLVTDARLELHTRAPSRGLHLERASVSLRCSHRGSRYQDATGLINIPHSTTFDLEAGVSLSNAPLSFRAVLYNLFNQQRFDFVGYPLPPRTLAIEAVLDWEQMP